MYDWRHAVQHFVKQYRRSIADATSKCGLRKVDAHGIARHPGGIKSIRLGRQVVRRVDGGRICWERLEHRHPEVVPELAIVAAWNEHIPLPESGAGAGVASSAVWGWLQSLDGGVAELDLSLVSGTVKESLQAWFHYQTLAAINLKAP